MKKIVSIITALTVFAGSALADEGMWLLPLLEKMNGKAMKELGCELTPKQIYNINNTSLKDAIVQFGGGCTGEIISDEGLLVTNHHCGYGNIQKLSSVEHDYLKDGYWAMNHSEELPCEGLTVTFLQYMEDLKPVMEKARKKAEKQFKGQENAEEMVEKAIEAAIDEAVVNVHHFADMIQDWIAADAVNGRGTGLKMHVSDERARLLETGGGLRKAQKLLTFSSNTPPLEENAPILICNVDILSNIHIPTLLKAYNPEEMGVVVVSPRDTQRYLLFDATNRLCGWTNIATGEVRPTTLASSPDSIIASRFAFSGMQVLNPRIFDVMDAIVAKKGEKFSLIDLYLNIAEKEILRAFIPENYRMMDVGKINQLSEAEMFAQSL